MQQRSSPTEFERQYLLRWKRLGPMLDAIRRDELRRMNEKDYLDIMERLWSAGIKPERRTWSGLVEWQRLMRR